MQARLSLNSQLSCQYLGSRGKMRKFKVIVSYIASLRLAWITRDLSKKKKIIMVANLCVLYFNFKSTYTYACKCVCVYIYSENIHIHTHTCMCICVKIFPLLTAVIPYFFFSSRVLPLEHYKNRQSYSTLKVKSWSLWPSLTPWTCQKG